MKFTILSIIIMCASVVHAGQYLCITDSSVGYKYNKRNKSWEPTVFDVKGAKYLIKKSEYFEYEVSDFGESGPFLLCYKDFDEYGYLNCSAAGSELKFNKNNGRFMTTHSLGYVNVLPTLNLTEEISGTPRMEFGKCSSF